MTERKATFALKKIGSTFENGFVLEALLSNYHLNINLLKLICTSSELTSIDTEKKIKITLNKLASEIDENQKLKSVISKRNLKIVKIWVDKMDVFFKILKYKLPPNAKVLFEETQKISCILTISAHKLYNHNN